MTDEELAAELFPDNPANAALAVAKMTPERRATYERLVEVGRELNLAAAGLGPMPADVIVCRPRRGRGRG